MNEKSGSAVMADESACCSTRRGLLGLAAAALAAPAAIAQTATPALTPVADAESPPASPEAALQRLLDGNARFLAGCRRASEAGAGGAARAPFAVLLMCADSLLAPETLFDQTPGDLLVLRVAGAVLDDSLLASIEYGVLHLGARLVMVMGHERCAAVTAAIQMLHAGARDDDLTTAIPALAAAIAPAVDAAQRHGGASLGTAIAETSRQTVRQMLVRSRLLRTRTDAGALMIVAAHGADDDGKVRVLTAHISGQGEPQASPVSA